MFDWNDPETIRQYREARIEYKRYREISEKTDYKHYVSFDMAKKRMNIVPLNSSEQVTESYSIGKLLLDFVNLDLTEYQREWEKVRHMLDYPDEYIRYSYFKEGFPPLSVWKDDAIRAKSLCLDRLIKDHQHLHPYLIVYDTGYFMWEKYDHYDRMDDELHLLDVQKAVKERIDLYLNDQIDAPYAHLTASQRYLLHYQKTRQFPFLTNHCALYVRIPGQGVMPKKTPIPAGQDKTTRRDDLIIEEGYAVQTARDIAMLELSRMVMLNMRVRRCAFCGKLFSPTGKHNARFCNNIPAGHTESCQVLGSRRAYAEKMRETSADAEYRKIYKRLHQRKQKGAMTEQAFYEWQGNAQYWLQKCRDGELTLSEFIRIISQ